MPYRPCLINVQMRKAAAIGTGLSVSGMVSVIGRRDFGVSARDSLGALADADTLTVMIQQVDANNVPDSSGLWEVCDATYTAAGPVITRGTVIDGSSGAGVRVNFTAATLVSAVVAGAIGPYSNGTQLYEYNVGPRSTADSIFGDSAGSITASERIGARGDGNATFYGRFGASYRRADGTAIAANQYLGAFAFGGQWGTGTTLDRTRLRYAAGILGMARGSFNSAAAMPTAIVFCTGSDGFGLTDPNHFFGNGRVMLDEVGNLTMISAAALGYGAGSGGVVTQATSKATGVTLNRASGQITLNGAALAASTAVSFTFTNSLISATDVVNVCIASAATAGAYLVMADQVSAGSCRISLRNLTGGSLSEALVLTFNVSKGATA